MNNIYLKFNVRDVGAQAFNDGSVLLSFNNDNLPLRFTFPMNSSEFAEFIAALQTIVPPNKELFECTLCGTYAHDGDECGVCGSIVKDPLG